MSDDVNLAMTDLADIAPLVEVAPDSTVSRTVLKAEGARLVLFSFDAGQELTEHTAAVPVLLQALDGSFEITAAGRTVDLLAGRRRPPRHPHTARRRGQGPESAAPDDAGSAAVLTMSGWTPTQARSARLRSLLLGPHPWRTADEVVTWFGAMQAQDLASALWSLGLRLPGSTEKDMLTALEQRQILRTWPMRGTIHLVPAEDAHWMLGLMGSTMMATSHRRRENLGLTQEDTDKATAALADALSGGGHLTRSQALATINDAGVTTEGQRGYHLLWYAALTGVTCIGPQVEGEQTFVLLDEWVATPRRLEAREAAAELAYRYFRSHGPAPVSDFAGWSGLGLRITRTALNDNAGRLTSVTVDGEEMWLQHGAHRRPRRGPTAAPDGRAAGLRRAHPGLQGPAPARPRGPIRRHRPGRQRGLPVHDRVRRHRARHLDAHHHREAGEGHAPAVRPSHGHAPRSRRSRARRAYAQYLGRTPVSRRRARRDPAADDATGTSAD